MKKLIVFIVLISFLISCKEELKQYNTSKIKIDVNDNPFVKNSTYPKGDARRYGVYPNKTISTTFIKNLIYLANQGLTINFPKGYYKTDLILEGITNASFVFNDAIIQGSLYITEDKKIESQKIKIDGSLTILDKLFIRKSNNISFNNVTLKTDTLKNTSNKQNRGVSIYAGAKNIAFKFLRINNTGGYDDAYFKYTAAALQIHGWNNNPENVTIKNLEINNVDRTGLYLTGKGHKIEKASITNFGLGNANNMFGLEDAKPNEEKQFSGAWLNKCNDCQIDSLEIKNNTKKGTFSLRLDEGKYHQPTFIYNINISGKAKKLPIKDNELTNILVKNEY